MERPPEAKPNQLTRIKRLKACANRSIDLAALCDRLIEEAYNGVQPAVINGIDPKLTFNLSCSPARVTASQVQVTHD